MMTQTLTASPSTVRPLARSWWRTHPTHRYAKMLARGVVSLEAWGAIATRLFQASEAETGDRRSYCQDRAYDAFQRAGYSANMAYRMSR